MTERLLNRWLDDLHEGDDELTRRRTVTETDVVSWCMFTGDWHPIHSDKVYAAESQFGARLAPGLMVVAIAGGLAVPAESEAVLAQYGIDRVRYPTPTFVGDSIRVRNTVVGLEDRLDGTGVVDLEWTVLNQNDTTTCVVRIRVLHARRPKEA